VIAPAWMGVDFGTTNSAVAVIDESGAVKLVTFPSAGGRRQAFPSVLDFEPRSPSVAGSAAIER
jgi:molecular chaperone DnaK (HSP70)